MRRIVITLPEFVDNEAQKIVRMLDLGAERVHVRKPGKSARQVAELIDRIPTAYRGRITIHDHLDIALDAGLGGVHLNSRNSTVPQGFKGLVSRSCHSIAELADSADFDYMFLSPVFDSISKPGYKSGFALGQLVEARSEGIIDKRTFALGGVSPSCFAHLEMLGFGGAAMIGAAWEPVSNYETASSLQYITPPVDCSDKKSVVILAAGVSKVLAGGCRWVQLRMKDATARQIINTATAIGALCRRHKATFILDDRVDLVEACNADGVHLGANDMPVDQARRLLGPGYIVGATANTYEMLTDAVGRGADYIGLGPLRFTTTKKNLSPTLDFSGYRDIFEKMNRDGVDIPVVAIGGITADDIEPLAAAGVRKIAVSGSIINDSDPTAATQSFVNDIIKYMPCKVL